VLCWILDLELETWPQRQVDDHLLSLSRRIQAPVAVVDHDHDAASEHLSSHFGGGNDNYHYSLSSSLTIRLIFFLDRVDFVDDDEIMLLYHFCFLPSCFWPRRRWNNDALFRTYSHISCHY